MKYLLAFSIFCFFQVKHQYFYFDGNAWSATSKNKADILLMDKTDDSTYVLMINNINHVMLMEKLQKEIPLNGHRLKQKDPAPTHTVIITKKSLAQLENDITRLYNKLK